MKQISIIGDWSNHPFISDGEDTGKYYIDGDISLENNIDGEDGIFYTIEQRHYEIYQGPYTVTPSEDSIVLQIDGCAAKDNITIDPIPSNYGLITWTGSHLLIT